MKPKKAFTLIELLVVIAIIGILATISVLALQNARAKSRDAKRAGDVKQIQTALELFFNDNNRYPTIEEWNTGKIYSTTTGVTSTYMQIIPNAPTPADGTCTDAKNTVGYTPSEDGTSYAISFCLGNTTGTLTPGPKCLTPGGVLDVDCSPSDEPVVVCSCSDISQECCGSCALGDICGGGTVVVAGLDPLVVAPVGCTDVSGGGCGLSSSDSISVNWDNPALAYNKFRLSEWLIPAAQAIPPSCPTCVVTGANSLSDGRDNITNIKSLNGGTLANRFVAAKFCEDFSFNGFSDWYLPAYNELVGIFQASDLCNTFGACTIGDSDSRIVGLNPSGFYWSSSEVNYQTSYTLNSSGNQLRPQYKNFGQYLRCVR